MGRCLRWSRAAAAASQLLFAAVLLEVAGASDGVDVVFRAETSLAEGADSAAGALLAFEVDGRWLSEEVLCAAVGKGETVQLSVRLRAWPTRVRLRMRLSAQQDAWGLRSVFVEHVASGTEAEVLPVCYADACNFTQGVPSDRWVTSADAYLVHAVPPLGPPEWHHGPWGPCCCPAADPFGYECTPGSRTRLVTCSAPGGSCMAAGPRPVDFETCQDYSQCPYEPLCPLGRHHACSCDVQVGLLFGVTMVSVLILGFSCRFCSLSWLPCGCERGAEEDLALLKQNSDVVLTLVASGIGCPPQPQQVEDQPSAHESSCSGWTDNDGRRDMDQRRMMGTWFYGQRSRYFLSRAAGGQVRFDEQLSTGEWAFGLLEPMGEWMEGICYMRNGTQEHGHLRLRYDWEQDVVVSSFQGVGDATWGALTIACKARFTSAARVDMKGARVERKGTPSTASPPSSQGGHSAELSFTPSSCTDSCLVELGPPTTIGKSRHYFDCGGLEDVGNGGSELCLGCGAPPDSSAAEPLPGEEVPPVLHVTCPDEQLGCAGEYRLVKEQRPNGQPLWARATGGRWIYSGIDGSWYIGGPSSVQSKFQCSRGYLCTDAEHRGATPDRMQGAWLRGDGEGWAPDHGVVVSVGRQAAARAEHSQLMEALDSAGAHLAEHLEEDAPGSYVIVHDNTSVTLRAAKAPPVVARLPAGTQVVVTEISLQPRHQRVRARIEHPAGWISLRDTSDGYRWARRSAASASDASTSNDLEPAFSSA